MKGCINFQIVLTEGTAQNKTPCSDEQGVLRNSLAVTYFHTGIRTIIGAASFHGPVRDGKGWFQRAMAAKHKGRCVDF
jgi:hypothetical protein